MSRNDNKSKAVSRLREYFSREGISVGEAERRAGLPNATLRRAFSAESSISLPNLEKILSSFPGLSAEWVLRGRVTESVSTNNIGDVAGDTYNGRNITIHEGDCTTTELLIRQLDEKDRQLKESHDLNMRLVDQIKTLTEKVLEGNT